MDIGKLLLQLNLPENLFNQMEDLPEELWAYILDEIIYEAQLQKFSKIEKTMIEQQKSKKDKLFSAIQRKRKDVAVENLETIKTNKMHQIEERKRTLERDKQ